MKHLGFKFEFDGQHAAARDDWQRGANGYRVTFTYDGRTMSTDYWQGSAITSDPDANSVMACLVSDAMMSGYTFEDFCSELGYDSDSRRAEQIWKACRKIDEQLHRLFGADYGQAIERDWEQS
jgi:hypothetical protein